MNHKREEKIVSRVDATARTLKKEGEKALVIYLTAGYPDKETFVDLLHAASQAGCDMIEIGVPFSDPIADGPVIQEASQRALESGISLTDIIDIAGRIAGEMETPLVLMSYVNPVLQFGVERFSRVVSSAGICGVILPDVPHEESSTFREPFNKSGLTYIDLLAPTSGGERIEKIARGAGGFLYLVSVTGVTGTRTELSHGLESIANDVRAFTEVPVYVGFGISSPEQAKKVSAFSDGVIMGSAIIERIRSSSSRTSAVEGVARLVSEVKNAMNN
jgi:tryptophan synthase alpha chain